jgi:thioredoxin 1
MPDQSGDSAVVTVTDATFADAVLANDRPVVVDFWADWCKPCHMISKSLTELADEFDGKMIVAKLNADENPDSVRRYQVMSLPTLLVFRDGEVVASIVGARPKSSLRDALTGHL